MMLVQLLCGFSLAYRCWSPRSWPRSSMLAIAGSGQSETAHPSSCVRHRPANLRLRRFLVRDGAGGAVGVLDPAVR
jgi:hypothetical protein